MHHKLILILFVAIIPVSSALGELGRMDRVARSYEGVRASIFDRSLALDVLGSHWDIDYSDSTRSFRNTTQASFHYQTSERSGNRSRQLEKDFTGAIHLLRNYRGFMLRGAYSKPIDIDSFPTSGSRRVVDHDTLLQRIGLSANLTRTSRWYPRRRVSGPLAPFYALGGDIHASLHMGREESFEPQDLYDWKWDKFIRSKHRGSLQATLQGSAGTGRLKDASYVHHALALERELRRFGAVRFDLADETVADIADLMARSDRADLRDSDSLRAFKARLDSLLHADAAAEPEHFRRLSPFAIRRILLRDGFEFPSGLQAAFYADQNLGVSGAMRNIRYPNLPEGAQDTSSSGVDLDYSFNLGARAEWGRSVGRRVFVHVLGEKRLLSPLLWERYGSGREQRLQALAETHWDLGITFLPGQSFRLSWHVRDLPLSLRYSEQERYPRGIVFGPAKATQLRLDAFIEDYVAFAVMLSWHPRRPNDEELRGAGWDPFAQRRYGTGVLVRATYGF
jgi:hypothetical protein